MASNPFFLSFRTLCFYHLPQSCCFLGVTFLTSQFPCPSYSTRFCKVIHVIHKGVPKKTLSTFIQHEMGTSLLPSLAYSPKPPHKSKVIDRFSALCLQPLNSNSFILPCIPMLSNPSTVLWMVLSVNTIGAFMYSLLNCK